MGIDRQYKLVRKSETDTVRTHDSQFFDDALGVSGAGRDVQAGRGYPSAGREAWLKEGGSWKPIQWRGHRNTPPSGCRQQQGKRIAKVRAWGTHVLAVIDQMGGKLLHTIGQARANFAMMMACGRLNRLVYFPKAGVEAFGGR